MDLKDMILVTENDRGTETNMLMTLDDYKSFIAVDDMSELADNLLQLGRTLGKADNFTEYYRAANVTVSARFCLDDIQLGQFLQGFYNDSKEFRFDKEASSSECVAKLKEIGMTDKGWVDDFNLHYESVDRLFERGQPFIISGNGADGFYYWYDCGKITAPGNYTFTTKFRSTNFPYGEKSFSCVFKKS